MSVRHPAHYPITGLTIVSDPQRCPPSYDLLWKSHDKKEDCDLWKESGILRRTTRYICLTKAFPTPTPENTVITGLMILNERDPTPSGYTLVERTTDTGDRATRKKLICVKQTSRESVKEALIDIILLTKTKRAPEGYTMAGDVNGVVLCYKVGPIPLETQTFKHASSSPANLSGPLRPAPPLPPVAGYVNSPVSSVPQIPVPPIRTTLQRANSATAGNPLGDVPFQLNIKHQDNRRTSLNNGPVPQIHYRSLVDIENEFSYSFATERAQQQQSHFR